MNPRRLLAVLTLSVFAAVGCGDGGKKPAPQAPNTVPVAELESAKKENSELKDALGQKTAVMNQVQDELDALAKTGEVVTQAKKELEGGVKTREQSDTIFENVKK